MEPSPPDARRATMSAKRLDGPVASCSREPGMPATHPALAEARTQEAWARSDRAPAVRASIIAGGSPYRVCGPQGWPGVSSSSWLAPRCTGAVTPSSAHALRPTDPACEGQSGRPDTSIRSKRRASDAQSLHPERPQLSSASQAATLNPPRESRTNGPPPRRTNDLTSAAGIEVEEL